MHGAGLQEVQASTSEAGPRELPPWLQQQAAVGASGPMASTSYSVSQDGSDVKDVKSASPDEQKKLSQVGTMHWSLACCRCHHASPPCIGDA